MVLTPWPELPVRGNFDSSPSLHNSIELAIYFAMGTVRLVAGDCWSQEGPNVWSDVQSPTSARCHC